MESARHVCWCDFPMVLQMLSLSVSLQWVFQVVGRGVGANIRRKTHPNSISCYPKYLVQYFLPHTAWQS